MARGEDGGSERSMPARAWLAGHGQAGGEAVPGEEAADRPGVKEARERTGRRARDPNQEE
jgi:hypothetical protein